MFVVIWKSVSCDFVLHFTEGLNPDSASMGCSSEGRALKDMM